MLQQIYLILFLIYPTLTGLLLFIAKPFYNLFLPLPISDSFGVLCTWWDLHPTMVLHYCPCLIALHLHDLCG